MNFVLITIFLVVLILLILLVWVLLRYSHRVQYGKLKRYSHNPILQPRGDEGWESRAVFNTAALYTGGRIHLVYRALGPDGVSRLGYASSRDGLHFDERLDKPIYEHKKSHTHVPENLEFRNPFAMSGEKYEHYDTLHNASGGGWSGSEDPRMVELDNKVYLTYNYLDNWQSMEVFLSTINNHDFLNKNWQWSKSLFLSPQGGRHKNWAMFPEKINGHYAILHSIYGADPSQVRILYHDEAGLARGLHEIDSPDPQKLPNKQIAWHERVRSAGPPPLKTKHGWLVLYHAMAPKEMHRYKIGAMLLDLNDPSKIIARSREPILEPDMWYENDWKPGIVYSCGAIIKDDELYVYYGGGDKTINLARTKLEPLLLDILKGKSTHVRS